MQRANDRTIPSLLPFFISFVLTAYAANAVTGQALPITANITASVDGYINSSTHNPGQFDTVNTTASAFGVNDDTQRGAVEFNLAPIPSYANILAVSFLTSFDISTGTGNLTVDFGVYPGDGIIEVADATATSTIAGTVTRNVTQFTDPDLVIAIDPHQFSSVFNFDSIVGLNLWRDPASMGNSLVFNSINNGRGAEPPTLSIIYTLPEPSGLWGVCLVPVMMQRWRRAKRVC
jgi:hypothetical protein